MKSENNNRIAPASLNNIEQWQLSRKNFVKGILLAGVITQIPFLSACKDEKINTNIASNNDVNNLNKTQLSILKDIQLILFPKDGNGPSASDINADKYLQWVISDTRMDPSEVEYIVNGLTWVNETSVEEYKQVFIELSISEKEELVAKISKLSWGESWLSVILTLIFEALLCDPQYIGNPESVGWKWLNHYAGNPRPTQKLLYDEVFDTINQ